MGAMQFRGEMIYIPHNFISRKGCEAGPTIYHLHLKILGMSINVPMQLQRLQFLPNYCTTLISLGTSCIIIIIITYTKIGGKDERLC